MKKSSLACVSHPKGVDLNIEARTHMTRPSRLPCLWKHLISIATSADDWWFTIKTVPSLWISDMSSPISETIKMRRPISLKCEFNINFLVFDKRHFR